MEEKESFEIKGKVKTHLKDCLESLSSSDLTFLFSAKMIRNLMNKKIVKKDKVTMLIHIIYERCKYLFAYLSYNHFLVFRFLREQPLTMNELSDKFENSDENEDEIDDILYDLVRYGLVFKFHNNNQTIYSVPEEVAERTNHLKDSLDEDVELDVTSPAYMTAFINYARLLTSLYGVCSVDDVLEVYNRDFSESRFTKAFVIEQQPRIDDYVIDFVFTLDYMFYHSYLYNEDEIAEHILEERKQYTKMIPSPYNMEARLYCDDYDDVLPERAKVLDFLCRSFDDEDYAEAVVNDMIDEVRADYDLHKIMREIFEDDYFIFDIKKAELFLPLAIDLINAIHRWSLWGNSSNELL